MKNSNNIYKLKIIKNFKSSKILLVIVNVSGSRQSKNRVVEKIGSTTITYKNFYINIFRLLFWLSKNIIISRNAFFLLKRFNIF